MARELHSNYDSSDNDTSFTTDDEYWDCQCDAYYIHSKSECIACLSCNAHQEDSPDSRGNEIDAEKQMCRCWPRQSEVL